MGNIIKYLEDKGIDINLYPGILAKINCSEIDRIDQLLEENGISLNKIFELQLANREFFKYGYKKLHRLFEKRDQKKLTRKDIELLFFMNDNYNKYYTKEEVSSFCLEYNISTIEFIELFCRCKKGLADSLVNRLNSGKDIWVGKNLNLGSKQMHDNSSIMIKVSKISARKFAFMTGFYDISELEGNVIDILVESTGGMFYNYSDNEDLLIPVLINYCYKNLYGCLKKSVSYIENKDYGNSEEKKCDSLDEMDIFNGIELTGEEKQFLICMNQLLSLGDYDYESTLKNKFGMDDNSYESMNGNIRNKVLQKQKN